MDALMKRMAQLVRSEHGATAVEYAVMFALILVVAVSSIAAVGVKVATLFVMPGW